MNLLLRLIPMDRELKRSPVVIELRKKMERCSRGQALVELTLILPVLLTLTLGAVELTNIIYTYQVMHHLTAQGANMAARLTPPTTIDDVINGVIDASCPIISRGPLAVATCPPSNAVKWRVIYTKMGPDPTAVDPASAPYVVLTQRVPVAGAGTVDNAKRICGDCGVGSFDCTTSCPTPNVPNIDKIGSGQNLYAFEVFYDYVPITVLGNFVGDTFRANLYERSIF
jgi:TadE-like protein